MGIAWNRTFDGFPWQSLLLVSLSPSRWLSQHAPFVQKVSTFFLLLSLLSVVAGSVFWARFCAVRCELMAPPAPNGQSRLPAPFHFFRWPIYAWHLLSLPRLTTSGLGL